MRHQLVRVVYESQPYLITRREDGALDRAYGPFAPGTEPSLRMCGPDTEVHRRRTLATLEQLLPISPSLPSSEDTLAGG